MSSLSCEMASVVLYKIQGDVSLYPLSYDMTHHRYIQKGWEVRTAVLCIDELWIVVYLSGSSSQYPSQITPIQYTYADFRKWIAYQRPYIKRYLYTVGTFADRALLKVKAS